MTGNVTPLPRPRRQNTGPVALQGTLALDLDLGTMPPFPAAPVPALSAPGGAVPLPLLRGADSVPISAALREEVHRWAALFVQACVEAIGGQRPVSQLVRWTTPAIHQELLARAATVAAAAGAAAGPRRARRLHPRPLVSSVHSCFLATDRVEISVVVSHAVRSRCVAARMEKVAGRWQCTQIMFG
ncbi:Rv3235 family protein [Nocardioides sp. Bht2]|uniref:Rv3235 family protein n=1 Tax=Nocardioides sp. Bht2 TaxID=3392297 RepID=UPI0039B448BA